MTDITEKDIKGELNYNEESQGCEHSESSEDCGSEVDDSEDEDNFLPPYQMNVSNLSATTTERQIRDFFCTSKISVIELKVTDPKAFRSAIVTFEDEESIRNASHFDGRMLNGSFIDVIKRSCHSIERELKIRSHQAHKVVNANQNFDEDDEDDDDDDDIDSQGNEMEKTQKWVPVNHSDNTRNERNDSHQSGSNYARNNKRSKVYQSNHQRYIPKADQKSFEPKERNLSRSEQNAESKRGLIFKQNRGINEPNRSNNESNRSTNDATARGNNDYQNRSTNDPTARGNNDYQNRGNNDYQNRGNNDYQNRGNNDYQNRGNNDIQNRGNNDNQNRGNNDHQNRGNNDHQNRGNNDHQNRGGYDWSNRSNLNGSNRSGYDGQNKSQNHYQGREQSTISSQHHQGSNRYPYTGQRQHNNDSRSNPNKSFNRYQDDKNTFRPKKEIFQRRDFTQKKNAVDQPPSTEQQSENITSLSESTQNIQEVDQQGQNNIPTPESQPEIQQQQKQKEEIKYYYKEQQFHKKNKSSGGNNKRPSKEKDTMQSKFWVLRSDESDS